MKTKTVTITLIFVIAGIISLIIWNVIHKTKPSQIVVESMGDGKGVFVGTRRPEYEQSDPSKWSTETRKRVEQHESDVNTLNEGWKYIGIGDDLFNANRYAEAAEAYKKSYEIDRGGRPVSGFLLAETYEKMGKYDEAISLLDALIKDGVLSENGIQKANEIRARLLAAKNKSNNSMK